MEVAYEREPINQNKLQFSDAKGPKLPLNSGDQTIERGTFSFISPRRNGILFDMLYSKAL
jgi:hypothetical protein